MRLRLRLRLRLRVLQCPNKSIVIFRLHELGLVVSPKFETYVRGMFVSGS